MVDSFPVGKYTHYNCSYAGRELLRGTAGAARGDNCCGASRAKRSKFPQASFALLCFRMRRAKDPPRPRHKVLVHRDGLAQTFFAADPCDSVGGGLAKYERDIVVISKRAPSVCQRLTYDFPRFGKLRLLMESHSKITSVDERVFTARSLDRLGLFVALAAKGQGFFMPPELSIERCKSI